MTWEEYCISKKIDSGAFLNSEPEKWKELKGIFDQVHPNSFTEQKKFLINDIRRKYTLRKTEDAPVKPVTQPKPMVKIPPKPSAS